MQPVDLHSFQRFRDEEFSIVIDVMPAREFAQQHVPGAYNIPLDAQDFEEQVRRAVPDRDTRVIIYCHGRDCDESRRAAYRLEGMGYRNVHDFQDGIACWREAGLNTASEPQRLTH